MGKDLWSSSYILPDDFSSYEENIGEQLPLSSVQSMWEPYPMPKCECGAHTTYGKDCPPEYHSDYCDLYKPKEKL